MDVTALARKIDAEKLAEEANKGQQPINFLTGEPTPVPSTDMVVHWLAKNAYVYLDSGVGFGKGGANYLRMNVATSRKTLRAALDSIREATKRLT